ncbi:MAG: hypothetical protein IAE94_10845 [Chthoniobacterales bacterium]|nr:hypothetical protein [Chthoniobacterales bacterium]
MGLSGGSSEASIEHDVVESWRHELDKKALANRKKGEWVFVPRRLEHEFTNDFSAIERTEALYFQGAGIPTIRVDSITPESWDESGTIASFSAGSGAAALRDFFRLQGRKVRGPKAKDAPEREPPEPPPGQPMTPPALSRTNPLEHLHWLRAIRRDSCIYHRWGTGADQRPQWKPTPACTRTKSIEGDVDPGNLDIAIGQIEDDSSAVSKPGRGKKRVVRSDSDLRRYTVNTHPALARALCKMVANGEKSQVIAVMEQLAPGVAAKFQEITGRQCVALSVHFDSNMPHWNIWHSGVERVIFTVGKTERERYRRTAFDLNSSGNLLAWHRTQLAFERLGKDFRALSSPTVKELEKGLNRAMERQGRPPGDWTINETADSLLESELREMGKVAEIEAGFKEFVENEERRYRDGVAGREPKDARKLAVLLKEHESTAEAIKRLKRADEIQEIEMRLKPNEGESLADAAARVVERAQVLAIELSASSQNASVLRTERDELEVQKIEATKVISQLRSALEPDSGESLVAAAKRLATGAKDAVILKKRVAKLRSEGEEICAENEILTRQVSQQKTQFESEQKKVQALEEEVTPLRRLRERARELLLLLMKSPWVDNFEESLKSLLIEVGKLVGISIFTKEKATAPEVDKES